MGADQITDVDAVSVDVEPDETPVAAESDVDAVIDVTSGNSETSADSGTAAAEPAARSGGRSRGRVTDQPYRCGFCGTDHHERCPRIVRNGARAAQPIMYCACQDPSHGDLSEIEAAQAAALSENSDAE